MVIQIFQRTLSSWNWRTKLIYLIGKHLWNIYYVPKIALRMQPTKMAKISPLTPSRSEGDRLLRTAASVSWTKKQSKGLPGRGLLLVQKKKFLYKF